VTHDFDPGYAREPFASLVRNYPGTDVYTVKDFRVEWGPIFHRGRLDGTPRVLVIGQDPGAHETFVRRILVGEAGQRVQGFLAKLGIERSYVMVNTFLYSVYGQGGGSRHQGDPVIAEYRNRWLEAILAKRRIEAVVAFGGLADAAYSQWLQSKAGKAAKHPAYEPVPHPTYPESSSRGDRTKLAQATAKMLAAWNDALGRLAPAIKHPDVERALVPYGTELLPEDRSPIPEADYPPGLPDWMRGLQSWSDRVGASADLKRATLVVTIPPKLRPWQA
jgi:hypothetical protein